MVKSITKSWSAVAILFTVLLTVGFCPTALPSPQEPPMRGGPRSDEDMERMMEQMRQRMEDMQQRGDMPFPGGMDMQDIQQRMQNRGNQRGNRNFTGFQTQPTQPATEEPAQQMTLEPAEGETLRLNFKDVELNTFIKEISELLGMTPVIIDSDVQGTVTMYSSTPMTKSEVLPLFNLILKQNNASLIEHDGIYQVVLVTSGLKAGIALVEHATPQTEEETNPGSEPEQPPSTLENTSPNPPRTISESSELPNLSTHVIRVEFVPAQDLVQPIQLLMTEGGVIMPYDRLNMLILTDYSDSVERIKKIIHLLDNQYMNEDLIDLIKIENNLSSDIVADLEKVFGTGAETSATGISFVSLDRLNSIFVMASSNRALTTARKWITELDAVTGRNIQTYVYIVENSTAANIAMLLAALYGEDGSTTGQTGGQTTRGGTTQFGTGGQTGQTSSQQRGSFGTFSTGTGTTTGTTGTTLLQSGTGQTSGGLTSSGFSRTGTTGSGINIDGQQLGAQFTTSQGISSMIIQGGEFSGLQDTVRIVVDDISNRLIIQSTSADYAFILETIQKMDVMPRQVVIDARVFEVDLTDDLSFGVAAALQGRSNGSGTAFGLNIMPNSEEATFNGAFTAANVALVGNSNEFLSAIQALREKTNVKVLEAPSVLAMDGTEAHITVGGEVPYAGSIYYQDQNTSQSVQYRDTGVTLYVRPRISASGSVTMEILQEVSGVGTVSSDLGPTFTKSQVETTLTVKDGETVAIAGLIRDSEGWTKSGFPLISEIPIIGSLFGTTAKSKKRTELIIMITPHVIKDPDSFKEFTNQFKDSLSHVRKFADETERKRVESLQEAVDDRIKAEEEQLKEEERQRMREERKNRRKRN